MNSINYVQDMNYDDTHMYALLAKLLLWNFMWKIYLTFKLPQVTPVTVGSSVMSTTHTLKWVWIGPSPAVEWYSILQWINAMYALLAKLLLWNFMWKIYLTFKLPQVTSK
jgi:hypothetical protein